MSLLAGAGNLIKTKIELQYKIEKYLFPRNNLETKYKGLRLTLFPSQYRNGWSVNNVGGSLSGLTV